MSATERNGVQHEDAALNGPQIAAADALISGATDAEASEAANVSRQTVWRWRTRDPHFQAELNRRRSELWEASADQVRALIPVALSRLRHELEDGEGGAKVLMPFLQMVGAGSRDYRPTGATDARKILEQRVRDRRASRYYGEGLDEFGDGPITDEEIRREAELSELEIRYGSEDPPG